MQIMRIKEVIQKTGLSRATIYRLSKDIDSDFPPPVKLSAKTIGWVDDAITNWIAQRPARTNPVPAVVKKMPDLRQRQAKSMESAA